MWNPFQKFRHRAVLVPKGEPEEVVLGEEIETASLKALARRQEVRAIASSIHEKLAADALLNLQGR